MPIPSIIYATMDGSNDVMRSAKRKNRTMNDALKRAVERAAQQSEQVQAAITHVILEMLDADAKWESLLSDPRTAKALVELRSEAHEDVRSGRAEDIPGDRFLS